MANYPVPYQPNYWNTSGIGQQMYPQYQPQTQQAQPQTQSGYGLTWVDGEIGAKAFQMPAGWPAGQPIALWDTNDTVIYLKSTNAMGMPNPLKKARYHLEDSGETHTAMDNLPETEYVRKEDMEQMKRELLDAINATGASAGNRKYAREAVENE